MEANEYFWIKIKSKSRPLPKAKEKYLEAEETLFQELEEHRIGYRLIQPKIGGSIFQNITGLGMTLKSLLV